MLLFAIELPGALDAVAIALIGIFAVVGAARGALRGLLRIVAGLAALVIGRFSAPLVAPSIGRALALQDSAAHALCVAMIAGVVMVALGIVLHRFDETIQKARLPIVDPILGLGLGLLFGVGVVTTLTILTLAAAPSQSVLARDLNQSKTGVYSLQIKRGAEPMFQKLGVRSEK